MAALGWTIIIIGLGVIVLVIFIWLMISLNSRRPEVERKWTDPSSRPKTGL